MPIVIPDASGKLPVGYREEIRLPLIEIPRHLQQDLDANPHLVQDFYLAVGKAVSASLNTEDTRLRVITDQALKERIEACYRIMIVLRHELGYSLRKCFDLLPGRFVQSLRNAERGEDTFERTVKRNTWSKDDSERVVQLDKEELQAQEDYAANEVTDDDVQNQE
jgi:hypothetical protein